MRSFDAIDAELSALMGREASVTQALAAVARLRGVGLDAIDAMLDALDAPTPAGSGPSVSASAASPSSAPLDADALFEDVGTGRQSMMAPLDAGATEAVAFAPDTGFDASGDLAGLLEGSNSLMPPAPDGVGMEDVEDVGASVISLDGDDDYEEMQAVATSVDDDDLHSTEIEIVED